MYGEMQASGLTDFSPFICNSAIWASPVSLFTLVLAFSQVLSDLCEGWWHQLDRSYESPHSHLEARNR